MAESSFSISIKENIMLPLILDEADVQESKKKCEEMAEKFAIADLLDKKPYELSGGEKQKIALLRALNKSGRILVLDEQTSNYDQESEEEFIKLISELKYDIIIIVTHSEKIVNIANKVIKLEKRI